MALSTYGGLKASIADWLQRDDLTSVIPDFIALAESDIQSQLVNTPYLHTRAQAFTTSGNPTVDTAAVAKLVDVSCQGTPLRIVDSGFIRPGGTQGTPTTVCLEGEGKLRLYPTPDAEYVLDVLYVQVISPALAGGAIDDNATNWLLMQHPAVYLFGALAAAEGFLKNDGRISLWETRYQDALTKLKAMRKQGDLSERAEPLYLGMYDG